MGGSIKSGNLQTLRTVTGSRQSGRLWVWGNLLAWEACVSLSIIISVLPGIVVDDTVHFLSKYLRARREQGLDAAGAVHYAFSTVGTALWVTTVVLIAGFTVLVFSSFKMNAGMG